MGGGSYSASTYEATRSYNSSHGIDDFVHTSSGATTTHESLDIAGKGLDGKGAVRESRDSAEHPLSLPVAIFEDVTGSMASVPRLLLSKLPQLLGLLQRKGYATDPQILFAAIGDATVDKAPLQVGQFESDNRMDSDLTNLLLEGGGGGTRQESYELALYFLARHTATDSWERRGHRGYAFIIGDEMAYPAVKRAEVARCIGDTLQEDIPLEEILAEAREKWDIYYIMPEGASYAKSSGFGSYTEEHLAFWRNLLGQHVIELDDLNAICETIALTVGLAEGTTDLTAGLDDLRDVGSSAGGAVSKALATIGSGASRGGVVAAPPPGDLDAPGGNERL
jgi:hypothetical protein